MSDPSANDRLVAGVVSLTKRLHQDLEDIKVQTVMRIADAELPDACASLDHVVQLTEKAAHRTLDLVDEGRAIAGRIAGCAGSIAANDPARDELETAINALRKQLTELALAQGYQDITGQIIKRVIGMVRRLEGALVQLLRDARDSGIDLPKVAAAPSAQPDMGPRVPNVGKPAASQNEADDLLSSLGL